MNPRQYLALAAALREVQPDRKPITEDSFEHEATVQMHAVCVGAIADAIDKIDGPPFDRQRFLQDAGVDLGEPVATDGVGLVFEDDLRGLEQ